MVHKILVGSGAVIALNLNEHTRVSYLLKNHEAEIINFSFDCPGCVETSTLEDLLNGLRSWSDFQLLTESEVIRLNKLIDV